MIQISDRTQVVDTSIDRALLCGIWRIGNQIGELDESCSQLGCKRRGQGRN